MKKIVFGIIFWTAASLFVYGDNMSAASYLLTFDTPKYSAMGSAVGAAEGGIAAMNINPASIASLDDPEFLIVHNIWIDGITSDNFGFGKAFDFGSMGIDISYMDMGSINKIGIDEF